MGWVPGISQCANALVPRPALPAGGETRCSLAGGLESVRLCPPRGLWDSVSSSFSFSLSGPKVRSFAPPRTSTVKRCFSMDPVSHQRHPGAPDAVPQNVSPWEVTAPSICYHDRKLSKIPNIPVWLMEHDPTNGDELPGATFKACCFQRVSFYTSGHKHIQEWFTGRFLSASSFLSFFSHFTLLVEHAGLSASCHQPAPWEEVAEWGGDWPHWPWRAATFLGLTTARGWAPRSSAAPVFQRSFRFVSFQVGEFWDELDQGFLAFHF